jgi:hypothetical protein
MFILSKGEVQGEDASGISRYKYSAGELFGEDAFFSTGGNCQGKGEAIHISDLICMFFFVEVNMSTLFVYFFSFTLRCVVTLRVTKQGVLHAIDRQTFSKGT